MGAEHSFLKDAGRVVYQAATDESALKAFRRLAETEGIIPAFESAHALVPVLEDFGLHAGDHVLINLSGRGDKDMESASKILQL